MLIEKIIENETSEYLLDFQKWDDIKIMNDGIGIRNKGGKLWAIKEQAESLKE